MDRAYSVGAIVPASMFIYGSTLIEETCSAGQRFAASGLSHKLQEATYLQSNSLK